MQHIIFRNDDVNPNSNIEDIKAMYMIIRKYFPHAEIWSAVNMIAKTSKDGSCYPAIKPKDIKFTDVNLIFDRKHLPDLENIASHGLLHLDHRNVDRDLQKYSILTSCALLNTKVFVPPFWRWNAETNQICEAAGVKLWTEGDWFNIDNGPVRENHLLFCFHSWKFTPETFEERFKHLTPSQ